MIKSKQTEDILQLEKDGIINFTFQEVPVPEIAMNPEFHHLGEQEGGAFNCARMRLIIGWDIPKELIRDIPEGQPIPGGGITCEHDNYDKNDDDISEALEAWLTCVSDNRLHQLCDSPYTPVELKNILEPLVLTPPSLK